jgi:cGMP-dependent protein kinase 2
LARARAASRRQRLWTWLVAGIGPEPGREPKVKAKDVPKKAVKCDMCRGLAGGAACVRACPTGAAIGVSPEQFLRYADAVD